MSYGEYYRPDFSFRSCSNIVKCLVIINVAVFFLQKVFMLASGDMVYYLFGLIPKYTIGKLFVWQPVTYMFLHGNLMHLFFNSFVLYMFGKPLEAAWGWRKFLRYYLICGTGAGLFIMLTSYSNIMPTVGASGAIYGILAAYGFMFPDSKVYIWFLFPIKAKHLVIILGAMAFFGGLGNPGSGISHFGHLGGLLVGIVYLKFDDIKFFMRNGMNFSNIVAGYKRKKIFGGWEKKHYSSKPSEAKVNRILDKILRDGIDSLTPEEKKIMDEYSSGNDTLH